MGETFAIILAGTCVLSCLISGVITYLIQPSLVAIPLALLVPSGLFSVYALWDRDEFGGWALILTLGLVASVMGSVSGIAYVKLAASRKIEQK